MDYQDFTIDLCSTGEGQFEARVVESPLQGLPPVPFPRPIEPEALKALLVTLDERASPERRAIVEEPDLWKLGHDLYQSLFHDGVADLFTRCRDTLAREEQPGLRLRIRFDFNDPEAEYLAALPWELLRDASFLSEDIPVVRDVVRSKPRNPLGVKAPLRILIVGAAVPGSETERVLKLERDTIAKALKGLVEAGQVELLRLKEISLDKLRSALRDQKKPIHILHFAGHGNYHDVSGNGGIFLVRRDGSKYQVHGETFASHLKGIPGLRLVVLNACKTARHTGHSGAPFNFGVAAAVLERTRVQAVVAHQFSISYEAAIRFSEIFYRRIAAGDDVDAALTEVRLSLRPESDEWETPVLFLSSRNGKLFNIDPVKAEVVPVLLPAGEPVRLGVRSFHGWGKDMDDQNDVVLDFVKLFKGRYIKLPNSWREEIFPDLQRFLLTNAELDRPLVLDFAAHSSIAFAAGWVLEAKSGLDVRVCQRTGESSGFEWHPNDKPVQEGPLWLDEPDIELSADGEDIAVAIAVSQPNVAEHVQSYIQRKGLPVGRILRATIAPGPGRSSVQGGAHCLLLAEALVSRIRQRRLQEREGNCHIFCAAPNALLFYLGQLSRSFGRIVLYEHPFGKKDAWGRYQKSIELEAQGEGEIPSDWESW